MRADCLGPDAQEGHRQFAGLSATSHPILKSSSLSLLSRPARASMASVRNARFDPGPSGSAASAPGELIPFLSFFFVHDFIFTTEAQRGKAQPNT